MLCVDNSKESNNRPILSNYQKNNHCYTKVLNIIQVKKRYSNIKVDNVLYK